MEPQDNEQPEFNPLEAYAAQVVAWEAEWFEGNTPELDEYLFKPVDDYKA